MSKLIIRNWGVQSYTTMYTAMQTYTAERNATFDDQLWLVQHPAVYTLGSAGKREHLLRTTDIPVIQCNRGGQVTYHGIGQQIFYVLLDLKRKGVTVRQLVEGLEQVIINALAQYGISADCRRDAPGVYVGGAKISSLGLRISHGYSSHGIALNVDMDLTPFNDINPCGYAGLKVVNVCDLVSNITIEQVCEVVTILFCKYFDYKI